MQQQSQQQQLRQQQQRTGTEPSPEIKAEVNVSTASAIIVSATDPYMVLVAKSAKHPLPVIPGGKVEYSDLQGSDKKADVLAVMREISEEIGTSFIGEPKYLGFASDPGRDIRIVPASKVMTAVVEPALPADIKKDDIVKAHFGCPDYVYVGTVDAAKIVETEELKQPQFIDIRKLNPGDLSAGHDVIVLTYRAMLEQGKDKFPEDSLKSFVLERDNFKQR